LRALAKLSINERQIWQRAVIAPAKPSEILLLLAGSSFSTFEVFDDCSGGNSRLSCLLGCGGRYFFDQEIGWEEDCSGEEQPPLTPIECEGRWFFEICRKIWLGPPDPGLLISATSLLLGALSAHHKTAFGVFSRLQIPDFDRFFGFFSLSHFKSSLLGWLLFVLYQWHRRALDARP
jgi:hypothetical protein